jgi:hypothetical protein
MSTVVERQDYPAILDGELDHQLSRWLWLVKWILLIPHFVVLLFLWIAVVVVWLIAFFAILFTKRYPPRLFEFVLGVMRWTWRVLFYGYHALGTDRYPPFTLGRVDDYPARLDVDYPGELSRGLVLVKWWLFAIPHYIVVGIFFGGAGVWNAGLVGILVLVAAVVLLFTRRYPTGIFEFVRGMNRWGLRVAAYALLMRDEYPPFRLDTGPRDARRTSAPEQPTPTSGSP